MNLLEAFIDPDIKNKINILWEDNKPLFRATEIEPIFDIKISKYFDTVQKVKRVIKAPHGPNEVTFYTETGLYELIMVSKKYNTRVFKNWIGNILISIREKGKYDLLNGQKDNIENYITTALNEETLKFKNLALENTSKIYIETFKNRSIVYFCLIKNTDDAILLKIGSTNDIDTEFTELEYKYKKIYIINVFESFENKAFEKFLLNHETISKFSYNELFLINEEQLADFVSIAKRNIIKFSDKSISNKVENEEIVNNEVANKVENEDINEVANEVANDVENNEAVNEAVNEAMNEDANDIDNSSRPIKLVFNYVNPIKKDLPIAMKQFMTVTVNRGYKYQIYDTEFKLIKTFSSLIDATRNNEYFQDCSKNIIHTAIENNTVYKNYRWMKLDRDLPDDTIQELSPTKETPLVKIGFVAMLNMEKTKIIEVFPDHKSAAANRKFKSGAPITKAVNCGTQSGGHYFQMWFDCSNELKDEYLSRAKLPDKLITSCSIPIEKCNALNNKVIKTYSSITDVIKEYQLSRASLKKAIEFEYVLHGFRWKYVT